MAYVWGKLYLYIPDKSSILIKAPELLHKTGLNQNYENIGLRKCSLPKNGPCQIHLSLYTMCYFDNMTIIF